MLLPLSPSALEGATLRQAFRSSLFPHTVDFLAWQDLISKLHYVLEIQVSFLEAPRLSRVLGNLVTRTPALWGLRRRLSAVDELNTPQCGFATGTKQILKQGLVLVEVLWQANSLDVSSYP